jgi:hypothetical protein
MSKVVLDTDVLIPAARARGDAVIPHRGDRKTVPCCSTISVAEVCAGMRPDEEDSTMALLDGLVVVPVTRAIAEVAGRFKRTSRARRLELADCLIAATALVESAALATGNVKDYPMREITVLPARATMRGPWR